MKFSTANRYRKDANDKIFKYFKKLKIMKTVNDSTDILIDLIYK